MIKQTLQKWCPNIIRQWYADTKYYLRFKFYPQGLANEMHRGLVGYGINWKNPQTLNEKINWLKFYGDTSQWSFLADKVRVRDYVKERIGEDVLPKLYGIWNNANDIDFSKLPRRFVLKTNHGCGTVIPVSNQNLINKEQVVNQLNKWIGTKFGYDTIEPHYMKIKPLVYAEELLENDSEFSSSLADYKVFCLDGKPYCVLVCCDRIIGSHPNLSFYNCDWEPMKDILPGSHKDEFKNIPKPPELDKLLEYATKLAIGHPQVRVDFYIVQHKILFGEITMTSQGGYMDYITRDYDFDMGAHVTLPSK